MRLHQKKAPNDLGRRKSEMGSDSQAAPSTLQGLEAGPVLVA